MLVKENTDALDSLVHYLTMLFLEKEKITNNIIQINVEITSPDHASCTFAFKNQNC